MPKRLPSVFLNNESEPGNYACCLSNAAISSFERDNPRADLQTIHLSINFQLYETVAKRSESHVRFQFVSIRSHPIFSPLNSSLAPAFPQADQLAMPDQGFAFP